MGNSTKSGLTVNPTNRLVPNIAIPMIAGAVSWLAVINAAPHREGLLDLAVVYGGWYILACIIMLLLRNVSADDLIKWSPGIGVLALVLLLITSLADGLLYQGVRGTIGIYPPLAVYAVPWHLTAPIYIAWLVRFSPAREAPGAISWKAFGGFCVAAAIWWVPLLIIPSVSGTIGFFIIFLLLSWLDHIPWSKLLVAFFIGIGFVFGAAYRLLGFMELTADQGVLKAAFGIGGLFGRDEGDAFQITYFLPKADSYSIFLSAVEGVGVVGLLAIMACLTVAIGWGFFRSRATHGAEMLLVQLFVAYLLTHSVIFFWAVTGMLPKADFNLPLFSGSGCDLIATMVMLRVILPCISGQSATLKAQGQGITG